MYKIIQILMLVFLLACTEAFAGSVIPPPMTYDLVTTGSTVENNTNFYAGLNWNLEGGITPALVLGVFKTRVKLDGDTEGGNLAFHVNLAGGVKPGKLKLTYLNGKEDVQGEIGVGYDFLKAEPLIGLGVNSTYVAAGVDIYLKPAFVPFAQLHTQGKFDEPDQETKCIEQVSGAFLDPNCTNPVGPPVF